MTAYSKAAKRRAKKSAHTVPKDAPGGVDAKKSEKATAASAQSPRERAVRPTPERMARGTWAEAKGVVKSLQSITDLAHDVVGQLHCAKQITDRQEQAARSYQELRARFLEELPEVTGYKSCLAGGSGGYDASDGNAATIRDIRALERSVGMIGSSELHHVCAMDNPPRNLSILRQALDAVAG